MERDQHSVSRRLAVFVSIAVVVTLIVLAVWPFDSLDSANGVRHLSEFEGRSQASIVAELGTPIRTFEYRASEGDGQPLRDESRTIRTPPLPPVARDARIRELTWERRKVYVTVLFVLADNGNATAHRAMLWNKSLWPELLEPPSSRPAN